MSQEMTTDQVRDMLFQTDINFANARQEMVIGAIAAVLDHLTPKGMPPAGEMFSEIVEKSTEKLVAHMIEKRGYPVSNG